MSEEDTAVAELEKEDGIVETPPVETKVEEKPDDLRSAMAELATTVKDLAKPKEEKPTELTQEQKDELWAVYNPEKGRPDFMKKFFRLNPEATSEEIQEAKDLFAEVQKGLVRQSVIGSKNLMDVELEKLRGELKPLHEYVTAQKQEQTRNKFYKAFPALQDEKFAKVVAASAGLLKDKEFETDDAYFKALAESAAETIKAIIPEFDLGAEKKEKKTAGTTPRIPRTSVGGSGGVGGAARGEVGEARNAIDDLEPDA